MQIVIDIPEREYKVICGNNYVAVCACPNLLSNAIKNGTPLPEGHGRLIDENEAIKSLFDYNKGKKTIGQCINDTPTVLEADKESAE